MKLGLKIANYNSKGKLNTVWDILKIQPFNAKYEFFEIDKKINFK